jgi:hypothetical protein
VLVWSVLCVLLYVDENGWSTHGRLRIRSSVTKLVSFGDKVFGV